MTVVIDTGILFADHDTDASRHELASAALEAVYDGEFGTPYVSDFIYDEAVTLTLNRSRSHTAAKQLGERLRGVDPYPDVFEQLRVTSPVFSKAVATFDRYDDQRLSFTDATTIALCDHHDLDYVLSFDDDTDR